MQIELLSMLCSGKALTQKQYLNTVAVTKSETGRFR